MGLRLLLSISYVLFFSGSSFLFFEEFDGIFRIDDDLSASLLYGRGEGAGSRPRRILMSSVKSATERAAIGVLSV